MSDETQTRESLADIDIEPTSGQMPARMDSEPRRTLREIGDRPAAQLSQERVIVRHSNEVDQLFAAMAEAQAEDGYGDVEKTRTARVNSKKGEGSSYTYTYETLKDVIAATRPYLAKHGIATLQFPFPGQTSVTIRTMLAHKSGQWIYNDLSAAIAMPDPQAVGSGISYLRRYALKSITGVAADDEDDDGQRASEQPTREPLRPAVRKSEQPAPKTDAAPKLDAPVPIGTVARVDEKGNGVVAILSTGYRAATRDVELIRALRTYLANGATVEFRTRASSDPAKYAPVLEELIQRRDAEA